MFTRYPNGVSGDVREYINFDVKPYFVILISIVHFPFPVLQYAY